MVNFYPYFVSCKQVATISQVVGTVQIDFRHACLQLRMKMIEYCIRILDHIFSFRNVEKAIKTNRKLNSNHLIFQFKKYYFIRFFNN